MTTDQIEYAKHLETIRSNQAKEAETHRANQASEQNVSFYNTEVARSNAANEKIKKQSNRETKRSNKAREKETNRSNLANEALKQYEIDANIALGDRKLANDYKINYERNETSRQTAAMMAAASRYAADQSRAASQYNSDTQKAISEGKNATEKQIAEAERYAKAIENSKDRAQRAAEQTNANNLKAEANRLEKLKTKIDLAWKNKQIQKWQYDALMDFIKTSQSNFTSTLNSTIGSGGRVASTGINAASNYLK